MPINFSEVCQELEKIIDPLANDVANLKAMGAAHIQVLLDAEPKERELIDEICANFAKEKIWPINMTPAQKFLVYGRLGQAFYFVEFLKDSPLVEVFENSEFAPIYLSEATLYKFLLVDYWHFAGQGKWRG